MRCSCWMELSSERKPAGCRDGILNWSLHFSGLVGGVGLVGKVKCIIMYDGRTGGGKLSLLIWPAERDRREDWEERDRYELLYLLVLVVLLLNNG